MGKLRKPWATAAWRKRREEILKTRSKCEWCGSTKILTMDHITQPNVLTEETYRALRDEDIIVLCRKCAMARRKGMNLCPDCKTRYKPLRFAWCFECFKKTEEGRLFLEERAHAQSEEEVPLIEVTLPCLEKVQVYEDHFKWGGILETCIHQCPSPGRADDVTSCEAFKQWKREEN